MARVLKTHFLTVRNKVKHFKTAFFAAAPDSFEHRNTQK